MAAELQTSGHTPENLAVGATFTTLSFLCVALVSYAPTVKVGPFVYTTIVFTALIDWAVWKHAPAWYVYLGMALVIGGGLVAIRGKTAAPVVVD
jgi:drug/metabolite transporter (DMT)-like permease